ncbi:tetratricopeptide repeat protein, partial [bacterium]|nr:tetratricopeptide repeat protein [bacterium]
MKRFLLVLLLLTSSLSLYAQANRIQEQKDYLFADGLYRDGNYQIAKVRFEKFLTDYPRSTRIEDALFKLAESHFFLKEYTNAINIYLEFSVKYPFSAYIDDTSYRIGESHFRKREFPKAIEKLKKFIEEYPKSRFVGEATYWIGDAHFNLNEYEDALSYYEQVIKKFPESSIADFAFYSQGYAYQKLDRHKEAVGSYKKLLALHPGSSLVSQVTLNLCESLYVLEDYSEIISILKKDISLDKNYLSKKLYLLGDSYYRLGDNANARENYVLFINKFPVDEHVNQAIYNLGWTYFNEKTYSDAAKTFNEVYKREQGSPLGLKSLFREAKTYRELREFTQAKTLYTKLADNHPDSDLADEALFETGLIEYYEEKDYKSALEHFLIIKGNYPKSEYFFQSVKMAAECYVSLNQTDSSYKLDYAI